MLQVIQFSHPGDEASKSQNTLKLVPPVSGYPFVSPWLACGQSHRRKFISDIGDYLDAQGKVHSQEDLRFWGEAEWDTAFKNISGVKKQKTTGSPFPLYEHNIQVQIPKSLQSLGSNLANTDPYVFGSHFYYSNCRQDRVLKYHDLSAGSMILFGSNKMWNGKWHFLLDTVFVVEKELCEIVIDSHGRVHYYDSSEVPEGVQKRVAGQMVGGSGKCPVPSERFKKRVLRPLGAHCAEMQRSNKELHFKLFQGKAPAGNDFTTPFSFVPVKPDSVYYPRMVLDHLACPGVTKSIKLANDRYGVNSTTVQNWATMQCLWNALVKTVRSQGYCPAWNFQE